MLHQYEFCKRLIENFSEKNSTFTDLILPGIIIFFVTQFLLDYILKPIREYLNTKNEIFSKLKFYANYIHNPYNYNKFIFFSRDITLGSNESEIKKDHESRIVKKYLEVSEEIRKIACEIEVRYYDNYYPIRKIIIRESKEDIENAVACLISISNSMFQYDDDRCDSIEKNMKEIKVSLHYDKRL